MSKPKNTDEYLAKLEGTFAHQPLSKVREMAHKVAPEIEEKIKWGSPSLEYKGLMITLVAFKNHSAVWFHKGALLNDPKNLLEASSEETKSMRKYIIPKDGEVDEGALEELIREAVIVNESGKKVPEMGKAEEKVRRSEMLEQALRENPKANENYESLPDYKKREYAEYIELAKQQATKQRRLKKSLALLEKGLGLNDEYR